MSSDLAVLVYQDTEAVSSQRPDGRWRKAGEHGLQAAADRLIGVAARVVVLDVPLQHHGYAPR
jgi:hypothetical protein